MESLWNSEDTFFWKVFSTIKMPGKNFRIEAGRRTEPIADTHGPVCTVRVNKPSIDERNKLLKFSYHSKQIWNC